MLGVAMGVLSLIVVVSVMAGFHQVIRERLLWLEPHVVVHLPRASAPEAASFDEGAIKKTAENFQLSEFVRVDSQDVIVRTLDGVFSGGTARGLEAKDLKAFLHRLSVVNFEAMRREQQGQQTLNRAGTETLVSGLAYEHLHLREHEVVLGIDLANSLGVLEGDQVLLIPPEGLLAPKGEMPLYERVTVAGRVATRVADLDSKLILYDREKTLLRMAHSPSRESAIEIRLKDIDQTNELKAALLDAFKSNRIESWEDRNSALFFALRMEKLVMTVFLTISGIITSFSIVSVLSLLISQKRREIGLMMALGMTSKAVQKIFVGVGLLLATAGILIGLIGGLFVCGLIDRFPLSILPDIYYDSTIPVLVTSSLIFAIVIIAFSIAMLSAYIPARGLSKLTPAQTFRVRG